MRFLAFTATILSLGFFANTAHAGGNDLLSFGLGATDIFNHKSAADFRLEYRRGDPLFWQIKPLLGIETTSRGATDILGGVALDLAVQPHWYITPSFAPGLYFHGDGKELGGVLEFRSQLEASYEFDTRDRVSLAFSHTSNADIYNHNPGTNALVAYYHFPLSRVFGGGDDASPVPASSKVSSVGGYSTYTPPENVTPAAGAITPTNNAAAYPNASPIPAATPEPF